MTASASDFASTDDWIGRCRARLLQLAPRLKTEDADEWVWQTSQVERYRRGSPEHAAEQLYRDFNARALGSGRR